MANKHIVLSFDSVYMKKSYRDDQKSLLRNSLVNCQFIENKHGGEKQHIPAVFIRKWYYLYINQKEFANQTE